MREMFHSCWFVVGAGGLIASDVLSRVSAPPIPPAWANYAGLLLLAWSLREIIRDQRRESREMAVSYEARLADAKSIRDGHLKRVEEDHRQCRQVHQEMIQLLEKGAEK